MSKFIYLLNAMEAAGNEANPAEHDYYGKRQAVLAYVQELEAAAPSDPPENAAPQASPSVASETTRTFDARTWAKSFNETLVKLGHQPHDEGWLIGWFANAIMCGYDEAHRQASADTPRGAAESAVAALDNPYLQMAAGNHAIGVFKGEKLLAANADVYVKPESAGADVDHCKHGRLSGTCLQCKTDSIQQLERDLAACRAENDTLQYWKKTAIQVIEDFKLRADSAERDLSACRELLSAHNLGGMTDYNDGPMKRALAAESALRAMTEERDRLKTERDAIAAETVERCAKLMENWNYMIGPDADNAKRGKFLRKLNAASITAEIERTRNIVTAAEELAPHLRLGWDESDEPEDEKAANAACDKLLAAIDAAKEKSQ